MDRQQHSWGLLVGRLRRSRMCRELAPARRAGRGQIRVYYPATRSRKRVMVVPVPVVEMLRCMMRRSEEHTSELQSLMRISSAVFCLKKKKNIETSQHIT